MRHGEDSVCEREREGGGGGRERNGERGREGGREKI